MYLHYITGDPRQNTADININSRVYQFMLDAKSRKTVQYLLVKNDYMSSYTVRKIRKVCYERIQSCNLYIKMNDFGKVFFFFKKSIELH